MARIKPPAGAASKLVRAILNKLHVGKRMKALPAPPHRPQLPAAKPKPELPAAKPWSPPPRWQGPGVPERGTWTGAVGDSPFRLSDAQAAKMGLPPGTEIRFSQGVPDFGPFAKPGPGGRPPGTFPVQGLKYEHSADYNTSVKEMMRQTGLSRGEVEAWLRENGIRIHHFQGDLVQLVPKDIHSLHHTGSRSMKR